MLPLQFDAEIIKLHDEKLGGRSEWLPIIISYQTKLNIPLFNNNNIVFTKKNNYFFSL